MNPRIRMTVLLAQILGAGALVGCGGPLDDEACLWEPLDGECPSDEKAQNQLEGTETCESPVRRVVEVGELLYSEEIPPVDSGYYGPTDGYLKCCYEARYRNVAGNCVVGRPLRVAGQPVVSAAVPCEPWPTELHVEIDGLDPQTRSALAEQWLRDAELEHASIAAFARLSRELVALGAPDALVHRSGQALADEVRHTRQCFEIASAYAGRGFGAGPLPEASVRETDLVRLAVESFEEGCVGETLAVCRAAVQLREATDPAVRRVLVGIIADEQRHAELAWDIVRWAIASGGEPVRAAVARALEGAVLPDEGPEFEPALVASFERVVAPTAREILVAA